MSSCNFTAVSVRTSRAMLCGEQLAVTWSVTDTLLFRADLTTTLKMGPRGGGVVSKCNKGKLLGS